MESFHAYVIRMKDANLNGYRERKAILLEMAKWRPENIIFADNPIELGRKMSKTYVNFDGEEPARDYLALDVELDRCCAERVCHNFHSSHSSVSRDQRHYESPAALTHSYLN